MRIILQRRIVSKLLIGAAIGVVLAGIVTTILVVQHQHRQVAVARANSIHQQLMGMADSIKLKQTYSSLPASQQPDFLLKQAAQLGIDMEHEKPTPDLLRAKCVENANYDLLDMATHIQQEYGDQAKQFYPMLDYAQSSSQAACYANYDPTGKQVIPPIMQHP